jgi:hypothetical protein
MDLERLRKSLRRLDTPQNRSYLAICEIRYLLDTEHEEQTRFPSPRQVVSGPP